MAGLAIAEQLAKAGTGNSADGRTDLGGFLYPHRRCPRAGQDDVADDGRVQPWRRLESANQLVEHQRQQRRLAELPRGLAQRKVGEVQFAKGDLTGGDEVPARRGLPSPMSRWRRPTPATPGRDTTCRRRMNSPAKFWRRKATPAGGDKGIPGQLDDPRPRWRKQIRAMQAGSDSLSAAYENIGDMLMKQGKLARSAQGLSGDPSHPRESGERPTPQMPSGSTTCRHPMPALPMCTARPAKTAEARAALAAWVTIIVAPLRRPASRIAQLGRKTSAMVRSSKSPN